MQRKLSEEYNVFSYDFGCKKKAVSDIPASRLTLIDFEVNTGKPA